jgi:hypothetical protein
VTHRHVRLSFFCLSLLGTVFLGRPLRAQLQFVCRPTNFDPTNSPYRALLPEYSYQYGGGLY